MWAYHNRGWLIPTLIIFLIALCGYAAGTGNVHHWNP